MDMGFLEMLPEEELLPVVAIYVWAASKGEQGFTDTEALETFMGKKPHELALMAIEIAQKMARTNALQFRKN